MPLCQPPILCSLNVNPLDTYTTEELTRCASWCLTYCSGPQRLSVAIRDRTQLLLSSALAFRGESSRILLWSDLFMKMIPMPDVGEDVFVPVSLDSQLLRGFSLDLIPSSFRPSVPLPTTQSITRRAALMSMVLFATVFSGFALSGPSQCISSSTSMSSRCRSLISHLISQRLATVSMGSGNGTITMCSGRSTRQRR